MHIVTNYACCAHYFNQPFLFGVPKHIRLDNRRSPSSKPTSSPPHCTHPIIEPPTHTPTIHIGNGNYRVQLFILRHVSGSQFPPISGGPLRGPLRLTLQYGKQYHSHGTPIQYANA